MTDLNAVAKTLGIYWREPANNWERFLSLWFRDYKWARRLLGGRWELIIHDKGTLHFVLSWHWAEKWHTNDGDYAESCIGKEFYRNGIEQRFDFGDDWYLKQDHKKVEA